MATRTLSPKRIAQRLREHHHAVIVLARQSAARAIKAQIRAQGDKVSQVPARTIRVFADAYFDVHRERLIAEAKQVIATSPYFARWRLPANITTNGTNSPTLVLTQQSLCSSQVRK